MRGARSVLLTAVLLVTCQSANAQDPAGAAAQPWPETIGCTSPADTARMRLTLPLEVLNHLQSISNSVFVHSFLIRHISAPEAGNHRLSRCARQFTRAPLTDFQTLRQNLPDATAIIDALRSAEEARLRTAQLADSARTPLAGLVARLRADLSPGAVNASGAQLAAAATEFCGADQLGACAMLDRAVAELDALHRARSALEATGERARQSAEEAGRVEADALAASAHWAADTLSLAQLRAPDAAPDSVALAELQARIARWTEVVDSLSLARREVLEDATAASQAHQQAATTAQEAQARLAATLGQLAEELRTARARDLGASPVASLAGARLGVFMAELTSPPVPATSGNPTARSPNLLLELTDFIIARARREAVNSFIINLHYLATREPLLRDGFRDTWGLMSSLSVRSDGRLNAVEVGRIPLGVWRATLAGDFVVLPVNLLEAGPVGLCRGGRSAADTRALGAGALGRPDRARPLLSDAERAACRQRAAVLRPLVPVARRLLAGDAVFDILSDASAFAPPSGPDLPPEWGHLSQALTILAALAETYLAQGYAPAADPVRHPYVLTARSLIQVPPQQREAFLRLLLVRAVPSAAEVPATIDPAALYNAAAGATRLLERIASRPTSGGVASAEAGQVLRSTFEAMGAAADLARVLAPRTAVARLDTIQARWTLVAGAIEPLVAGDFGMALSRTAVLLREVRGTEVPGPLLTFAALASSLSEAQTGEQIRAAFDAAASPVGGWQAKRYGEGGASVTAFPGVAGGYEYVLRKDGDPAEAGEHAPTLGAALPIGIEVQLRLSSDPRNAPRCLICGVGVFLPLIDLGALLSYRVDGPESVEAEPNASIRQVFAPGAYLSLALTRSVPVNLLVGAQLMPSLRKVEGADGTVNRSAIRYGIGLGMDILLFDF